MGNVGALRRARTIDGVGVLAVVVGLVMGLVPGVVLPSADAEISGLGPNDFEIDGGIDGANDWVGLGGEQTRDDTAGTGGDVDTSIFDGGAQREYNYGAWSIGPGNINNKVDLERLFLNYQVDGENSFVWLAASRVTAEGQTQVTAEFNQAEYTTTAPFEGRYRSDGDFRVRFNFPGNGQAVNLNIQVDVWDASIPDTTNPVPANAADGSWQPVPATFDFAPKIAQGFIDSGTREFVEVQVNISDLLFGPGNDQTPDCSTFGTVSFRTEPSAGQGGGSNPELKDFAGPYGIDLSTCGSLVVEKVDEAGNGLDGIELTLYEAVEGDPSTASDTLATVVAGIDNPCETSGGGVCDFGAVPPGDYVVVETGDVPAGYLLAAPLPVTVDADEAVTVELVDPFRDYTIDVYCDAGDADAAEDDEVSPCRNAVGVPHTFYVVLTEDGAPLAGAEVRLRWDGTGEIVDAVTGGEDADGWWCTTDADGRCEVVATSDAPGADGSLTATFDTPYLADVPADGSSTTLTAEGTVPYDVISDDSAKLWYGYRATVEADGLNLAGVDDSIASAHTFTVRAWETDGVVETPVDGETIAVALAGTGEIVAVDGVAITPAGTATCTTTDGDCTFTVDADEAGVGVLSVTSVSGVVGDGESLSVPFDGVSATKTWREYRALIDEDSINPAGTDHVFDVQVQQRDDADGEWVAAGDGITVDWDPAADAFVVLEPTAEVPDATTCDDGTDAAGRCQVVVFSDVVADVTVALTSVTGELDGEAGVDTFPVTGAPLDATLGERRAATKSWIDFGAVIEADAINLTDEAHTFTVTVSREGGVDDEPDVPDGTVVDVEVVSFTGGAVTDVGVVADGPGADCLTDGTVADVCSVTVTSAFPGTATVRVNGIEDYVFDGGAQDVTFDVQPTATKEWVRYRAFVEDPGVNLVGVEHPFVVTAQVDRGAGWEPVAGTTVVVAGAGLPGATIDQSDCTADPDVVGSGTDAAGRCTVVVNSATPGTLTVSVLSVANTIAVDSAVTTVDVADGALLDDQSVSQTKTWVAYRAAIAATAVNLTGEPHTFTITAEQDDGVDDDQDGSAWDPVPDGTTVGWVLSGDPVDAGDTVDTCGATVDGACTVTLSSSSVGRTTVTVTTVEALAVDRQPTAQVAPAAADKTWVAVDLSVEADATNVAGEAHVFDVTLSLVAPAGVSGVLSNGSAALSAATIAAPELVGTTCDAMTATAAGDLTCTITVDRDTSGSVTVAVDGVSFDVDLVGDLDEDGQPLGPTRFDDVDVTAAGSVGLGTIDATATKTWRAFRTSVGVDDLNRTGDPHTFTITVESTDAASPGEDDWTTDDVPDGTVVSFATGGVGTVTAVDGDAGRAGATSCALTDGTCTVTVNATTPGTLTLTVLTVAVDDPATPQVVDPVTVDTADSAASKTWAAFRASITDDAVNLTGDDHVFGVDVEYSTDGVVWTQVPDGSSVTTTSTGTVGTTDDGACDDTVAVEDDPVLGDHVCTVVVDSALPGDRTVEVTGVTATISAGGLTRTFSVAFGDPASSAGVLDTTAVEATKTWAAYTLELTPATALNLVPGDEEHVITAILRSDDPDVAPVAGQAIAVTLAGDTGTIVAVETLGSIAEGGLSAVCVTAADGTCDVTIRSEDPGTATLSGSYRATVGESDPVVVTSNDAVKVWTTYRISVTPEQATNLVDDEHVFTVTVEQSVPDADCAAPSDGWCPEPGAVPTIEIADSAGSAVIVAEDCARGTGADGTCTVTVDSDQVTAITLTATYRAAVGQTTAAFSDSGAKTWIDYDVTVTPDEAENLVGTTHTFTVIITSEVPGDGLVLRQPVAGAVPLLELAGNGAILPDDSSCDEGTDAFGACTVVITSAATGPSTLTATFVGAADGERTRDYVDSGKKLWVEYALELDEDATNAVGDPHTFTATLTRDAGEGPEPVVGEAVKVAPVTGVGSVVDETCSTGTDEAGQCRITIESDATGTTTVAVSYLGVAGETSATVADEAVKTWVAIELVKEPVVGDGADDGDLAVADGPPALTFVDDDPSAGESYAPQTAVYEFTLTNPGPVTLFAITLVDDRIGVVLDGSEGVTLAPGGSTTVRASETFTQDQVQQGALVTNTAVATGTTADDVTVDDDADAVVQLVTQLGAVVDIALEKQALTGTGDLLPDPDIAASGGIVQWFGDDIDTNATKAIPYQYTITNTGTTALTTLVLTDDKIGTLLDGTEGVVLQPGESYSLVVTQEVTLVEVFQLVDEPDIAFDIGAARQANSYANGGLLPNVATVTATDELGNPGPSATADELVRIVALKDVVTGFDQGLLLPLALLLMLFGTTILVMNRRFGRAS